MQFSRYIHVLISFEILRLPFDWKNPTGYMAASVFNFIIFREMYRFIGVLVVYGIAAVLYGIPIVKDMETIIKSTNDIVKTKLNDAEAFKQLGEFIKLHSEIKRLNYGQLFYSRFVINCSKFCSFFIYSILV